MVEGNPEPRGGHTQVAVSGAFSKSGGRLCGSVRWLSGWFKVELCTESANTSGRQKFTLVSLLTKHSEVSGGSN